MEVTGHGDVRCRHVSHVNRIRLGKRKPMCPSLSRYIYSYTRLSMERDETENEEGREGGEREAKDKESKDYTFTKRTKLYVPRPLTSLESASNLL